MVFIPGYQVDKEGKTSAFIQVISADQSYYITYPIESFHKSFGGSCIKIGKSIFSPKGIRVDIKTKDLEIKGKIKYLNTSPLHYSIMGPFALIPFMECSHRVVSMNHYLQGNLRVNGKWQDYNVGKGYIEGDRGRSFPENYLWTQCNYFKGSANSSVMVSIATIPINLWKFKDFLGCIAVVKYRGKEYRFATYLGVEVIYFGEDGLWIKQKNMELVVEILQSSPHPLSAPSSGCMNRVIHESADCKASYTFMINEKIIFNDISERASFEYADKE